MVTGTSVRWASRNVIGFLGSIAFLALSYKCVDADENWQAATQIGGSLTAFSFGESPYNHSAPFLQLEERRVFSKGAFAFRKMRPVGGASSVEGGPPIAGDYNARSCESCHVGDGRGISHTEALKLTGFSVRAANKGSDAQIFRHLYPGSNSQKLQGVKWETKQEIKLSGGTIVKLVAPSAIVDGVKRTIRLF